MLAASHVHSVKLQVYIWDREIGDEVWRHKEYRGQTIGI